MRYKLIILMIALITALAFFSGSFFAQYEGFTVTSIDTEPNIVTESNQDRANWIIDTSFNGGGQSLVGTITPTETERLSEYKSEYPLEITASAVDEMYEYSIINTGRGVYKYDITTAGKGKCPSDTEWVVKYYMETWAGYTSYSHDICVDRQKIGIIGELESPDVQFDADIKLEAHNDEVTKTVSNAGEQQNVDFYHNGQWIANAQWYGSLITGDTPPSESRYKAVYKMNDRWGSRWVISYDSQYDEYQNSKTSAETKLDTWSTTGCTDKGVSGSGISACTDKLREETSEANTDASDFVSGGATIGSSQTFDDGSSKNDASVLIDLNQQISNPKVVFKVDADWLGIRIPTGDPQINNVNCPEFASGDANGICNIEVTNKGNGDGTFYASLQNCDTFYQEGTAQKKTLNAGETDVLNLRIAAGTTGSASEQCTIKVQDYNDATSYDTATANIQMTEPKQCQPDTCTVVGDCVKPCKSDGSGYAEPLCCSGDQTLQQGEGNETYCGWYCKDMPQDDGDDNEGTGGLFNWFGNMLNGIGDGIFSGNWISKLMFVIGLAAFSIVGIIVGYDIIKSIIIKKVT